MRPLTAREHNLCTKGIMGSSVVFLICVTTLIIQAIYYDPSTHVALIALAAAGPAFIGLATFCLTCALAWILVDNKIKSSPTNDT